jgi:hypothetical protein
MMHCHILQHILTGQQTFWVFGTPEQIPHNFVLVNETLDGYFACGGNIIGLVGNEENGMMVAHYFDD